MKRFIAALTGIAAFVVLGALFANDISRDRMSQPRVDLTTGSPPELELELSPRLARPPEKPAPTASGPINNLFNRGEAIITQIWPPDRTTARYLAYLAAAGFVGLFIGVLMRRRPALSGDAHQAEQKKIAALRNKIAQRDDAMKVLEKDVDRRAASAAEKLNQPLQELVAQHEQTISLISDDLAARDSRIATQNAELDEKT
ncbi:MAG: hypothetical protein KJO35_07785, partial [Gammaproteobacteria bacterium]|nr:hypothetical protein [Gammaproteobacteria bacterium]